MAREYVTLEELAQELKLEVLTPEMNLKTCRLYHRNVNRPQFFLTGFEEYLDTERVQLFGLGEKEYLNRFSPEERREKFERLFATGIPGIILCHGLEAWPELIEAARKFNVPVCSTQKVTAEVMVNTITWMHDRLAPTITIHGVLVDVFGEGILITGQSGVGKSETAVELVKRGHRLVADDMIEISKAGEDRLIGKAPELTRHFIELRGIGVVDIKSLYGIESVRDKAPIDMEISLEEWDKTKNYDRLGLVEEYDEILGAKVVKHTVPIHTGRNLAIIIETAAVNNRQKKMGYNAAQALCDRVSAEIHRKKALQDKDED